MSDGLFKPLSRRDLLTMIGTLAGSSVAYRAMAGMGFAPESDYKGPINLEGAPKGATVLILGAGLAGLVAALELSKAGYKVQVLEYNDRAGGRNWSIRGGDTYTELGGETQICQFDKGLYINPGPWRLPYHHYAILDYCKRLGVPLEPFIQVNYNAYLHSKSAFGGKPQRYRQLHADFQGGVTELLAKSLQQNQLDEAITPEDQEILLESLRAWGALDKDFKYTQGIASSERRGYKKDPGGGLSAVPDPSKPIALQEILKSGLWKYFPWGDIYEFQTTLFEPIGGMGKIGDAFAREVGHLIRFNSKVTSIQQNAEKVTVSYVDTENGGAAEQVTADWCLCTIPLSVLSQIDMNVSAPMQAAINAVPYSSAIKTGLQAKRRFWEQDEQIFGGITYTDLPNAIIGYPNTGYHDPGKAVLLGAYLFGINAYEFTSMSPKERVRLAIEFGAQIHPQYKKEIENGVSVAWHRVPWTLGCSSRWTDESRKEHYENLCQIDGRIALAGEHASYLPAWQEGAITSSLDAIKRLHQRAVNA